MTVKVDTVAIEQTTRQILAQHAKIGDVDGLSRQQDLYSAGLTSFAAVQVMLALENAFDLVFPTEMLNKRSFHSIEAIVDSVKHSSNVPLAA